MQLDKNRAIRGLRTRKKKVKLSVLLNDIIIYIWKIQRVKGKLPLTLSLFCKKNTTYKVAGYQKATYTHIFKYRPVWYNITLRI